MLKTMKQNKLLTILVLFTILSFILSILSTALLDKPIKEEITKNIIDLINSIKTNQLTTKLLGKNIIENLFLITFIWLLGISIIGIPILLLIYLLKIIILSYKLFFLILNLKKMNILFLIIYLIPDIINILILFFLIYYSISYSILLIKIVFFKKDLNLKVITRRYIKVFIITFIIIFITSIVEITIIPNILNKII